MTPIHSSKELLDDETFAELLHHFSQGVLFTNDRGQILKVNQAFEHLSGYSNHELVGKYLSEFDFHPHPMLANEDHGQKWQGEVFVKQKCGHLKNLWLEFIQLNQHLDSDKHQYVFLYRDIHPLVFLDTLTNLPNRRCFQKCLNSTISKAESIDHIFAVLYIDLDRFKYVNDTLGHSSGDLLLKEASERMKSCLRKEDVLARIGGDEFICLLPHLKSKRDAETTANQLLEKLALPFTLFDHEIYISASIGISLFPNDGDDSETLVTSADSAMYTAKRQGRNQYEWFKAEIQAGRFEKLILENNLRKALQQDQLRLVYQPQQDLTNGTISTVEALIRWEHPDLGTISPADFIPLAEETGLIIPIGEWVLHEACRQNKEWQENGYRPVRVAVNLSSQQFLQPELPKTIFGILEKTKLSPTWLELEITESMIVKDLKTTTKILYELKEMGIHISIDDFGTGYSSLSYLNELPIDILKIDRSFIKDIETSKSCSVVTEAIISLAHALELKVVAEGVETDGQLMEIRKRQCDSIQGFLLSKPLPSKDVIKHFTRG